MIAYSYPFGLVLENTTGSEFWQHNVAQLKANVLTRLRRPRNEFLDYCRLVEREFACVFKRSQDRSYSCIDEEAAQCFDREGRYWASSSWWFRWWCPVVVVIRGAMSI